jgi:hypothetical protein
MVDWSVEGVAFGNSDFGCPCYLGFGQTLAPRRAGGGRYSLT